MRIAKDKLNFSQREIEVLDLVKEGHSSKEIADILNMTEDTIETYRRKMMKKTGAKNMVVVVYAAQNHGLI
jgi:two-component system response regulator NreC